MGHSVLKKSITAHMQGGLGNQCFIYAAGRTLADQGGAQLNVNINYLIEDSIYKRPYQLEDFCTRVDTILSSPYRGMRILQRARYHLLSGAIQQWRNYCCEKKPYKYQLLPCAWHRTLTLDGYWQSEKYFLKAGRTIAKDLCLKERRWMEKDEVVQKIQSSEHSVFLHVRSYKEVPGKEDGSSALPMRYYQQALDYLRAQLGQRLTIFIFSDDLAWAIAQLKKMQGSDGWSFVPVYPLSPVVEGKKVSAELRDFAVMRLCQHGIVADSSFSWWGGWLGEQDEISKGRHPIRIRVNKRCMNDDYWPQRWIAIDR